MCPVLCSISLVFGGISAWFAGVSGSDAGAGTGASDRLGPGVGLAQCTVVGITVLCDIHFFPKTSLCSMEKSSIGAGGVSTPRTP
jgi:hypothetical protein